MKRLKYILKKLRTLDYKNMIYVAGKVSKKTGKIRFFVLLDMIHCALVYGSGYMDYFEFEFYLLNKSERATYITSNVNNNIIKKYNDPKYNYIFDDKAVFNDTFKSFLKRDYINLEHLMYDDFVKFVKNKKKIVVKPLNECGGKGVQIISIDKKSDLEKIFNSLIRNKQFLVEDYINQCKQMSSLYNKSVNTLRILTFYKNKKVYILKSILKIGNGGSVDNFSSGGMYTFVDENGKVYVPAIDEEGNVFEVHPISKKKIVGFEIPKYKEVVDFVKELGLVVPKVRYVGWDIAITDDGPVVVEGNNFSGIFQVKPSISGIKTGDLPNYRKYMDI